MVEWGLAAVLLACSRTDLADMTAQLEDNYAAIRREDRTCLPYAPADQAACGEQIGIVDGDESDRVYIWQGHDPGEWLINGRSRARRNPLSVFLEQRHAERTVSGRAARMARRLFAALLTFVLLRSGAASAGGLPPQAEAALEAAVAEAHIPVMAVAMVDADGVVFEKIYGTGADRDTPFLLGSLSKSFTALCILQLEEQGLLDLDDPAGAYLDGFTADVTVRQLLNQTGGYGTYQRNPEDPPQEPAGGHIYSNLNYALLSRIVEAVSGETYEAYLQRHILEPLGMRHTTSSAQAAAENGLVQQYENWFGFPAPTEAHFPSAESWIQPGAGYISSSTADMARYLQMYLRGGESILPAEAIRRMFAEGVPVQDAIPYDYGFGWNVIREPLPQTVYRHAGLVETGMTCMYLLPEAGLGVILMADINDYLVGTDLLDRLGWNLVLSLLGEEPGSVHPGEYWLRHGLFDLAYAVLVAAAAGWLLGLPRFRRKIRQEGKRRLLILALIFGIAAPTFLLLMPRLLLATPLWVVQAFVPDLHLILWIAALLLYAGGALRILMLVRQRRTRPAEAR